MSTEWDHIFTLLFSSEFGLSSITSSGKLNLNEIKETDQTRSIFIEIMKGNSKNFNRQKKYKEVNREIEDARRIPSRNFSYSSLAPYNKDAQLPLRIIDSKIKYHKVIFFFPIIKDFIKSYLNPLT